MVAPGFVDPVAAAQTTFRAILAATGDYCLFLDGDCIARPSFVAMHRALAQRGWFVTGNRVLLSPAFTQHALRNGLPLHRFSLMRWLGLRALGAGSIVTTGRSDTSRSSPAPRGNRGYRNKAAGDSSRLFFRNRRDARDSDGRG